MPLIDFQKLITLNNLKVYVKKLLSRGNQYQDLRDDNTFYLDIRTLNNFKDKKIICSVSVVYLVLSKSVENYVNTLKIYSNEEKKDNIKDRESYLFFSKFYDQFQPSTIAELLNIDINNINKNCYEYFESDPSYTIFPWENPDYGATPNNRNKAIYNTMKSEFELNTESTYSKTFGNKYYGPCSEELINMEYKRLIDIYNIIESHGFQERYGIASGKIFKKGEQIYVLPQGMKHRIAVLIALDYKVIPIKFDLSKDLIDFNFIPDWYYIKNGLYTQKIANHLFENKIFTI